MHYTTIVRLVAAEDPERGLSGIQVGLFDRDLTSRDDALGTAVTDASGEARFEYTSEQFVDLDDRVQGVFPDLYVVAFGANGEKVVTTRDETVRNTPRKRITVPVTAEQASRLAGA